MRHASKDDVLADVRARLSLIEGHSAAASPEPIDRQPSSEHAQPLRASEQDLPGLTRPETIDARKSSAAAPATTTRSLDALYASVAAVYAETGIRLQATSRPVPSTSSPPLATPHHRSDNWSGGPAVVQHALADPDFDSSPAEGPFAAWPWPHATILESETPIAGVVGGAEADSAAAPASDPALDMITQRLASLEEKLESVLTHAEANVPSDDILHRLDELKSQYQRVVDEVARLEVIEDNLARLIDEVAERQRDNGSLADTVAARVASRIAEHRSAPSEGSQLDDGRLSGLEHMLSAYVSGRRSEDNQTQDLLHAIRSLVETLDSRVGVIEHEIQMAAAAEPSSHDPAQHEPRYEARGHGAEDAAIYGEAALARGPEQDQEVDFDDFDTDYDAATAGPEAAPHASRAPAARQRADEPTLPEEPRTLSPREQMIASARRAAQAAAASQPPAGSKVRAQKAGTAPGAPPRGPISNRAARFTLDKKSPRPVVIMALLALLIAGAGLLYGKMTRKPAGPKITIEKSVAPERDQTKKSTDQSQAPGEDNQSTLMDELPGDIIDPETGSTDGIYRSDPMPLSPTRAVLDTTGADDGSDVIGAVSDDLPPEGIAPLATRIKAANGDPLAQFAIAARFARGALGKPDMAKAAEWYERAAAAGHAPSQYQLAALLERGAGVPKDAAQARKWYGKSAVQGNVKAMHNLAVLMTTNDGGSADYAAAAKLFRHAADRGLADSQFNLAILYEAGLGLKRSTSEAYRWFALASEAGDKEAARRREAIRRRLSPSVIDAIDAEVKAWSPAPVDDAANSVPALAAPEVPAGTEAVQLPKQSDILLVQDLLKGLGYEVGARGQLDAKTSEAIASFEQRSKMPPTGAISDTLIARLVSLAG
jgi:localization factor PodJL